MMNLARTAVIGAVVMMFFSGTGCQSVKPPENSSEMWIPSERVDLSKKADPVWASIREQEFDFSQPLDLVKLIDIALQNNPGTRKAWEEARAARAVAKQAESQYYPQATAVGNVTRERNVADIESAEVDNFNYGPNVKITWLLLDFGGRGAAVEEAYQLLLSANFQFNQAFQDLLLATEQAYYELHSAQLTLSAVESDVRDAKTTLEAAQQKFKAGLGIELDVLEARSDYDKALYSLEEAKGEIKTQHANLAQTLGLSADTEFQIADPTGKLPTDISKDDVSRVIEDALKNRPDIAALRASFEAKAAAVRKANSDLWPSLSVGGAANKTWYDYRDADTTDQDMYGYTGYASMEWAVFDGFYNLNVKHAAKAEADAELANLEQAELEASADVWTKYYGFNTAVQKLKFGKAYFKSASASYQASRDGYNAGLKSILDVLSSQDKLSEARRTLIQAEKDVFVAIADLAHATGTIVAPE